MSCAVALANRRSNLPLLARRDGATSNLLIRSQMLCFSISMSETSGPVSCIT